MCRNQQPAKQNRNPNFDMEHLHAGPKFVEKQPRPILKVKSAAEQHRDEGKTDDVLLSQDAMREILGQLSELQELKKAFGALKEQTEKQQHELEQQKQEVSRQKSRDSARSGSGKRKSERVSHESSHELSLRQSYGPEFEKSLEGSKEDTKKKDRKGSKKDKSRKTNDKLKGSTREDKKKKIEEPKSTSFLKEKQKEFDLDIPVESKSLAKSTSKGSFDKNAPTLEQPPIKKLSTIDERQKGGTTIKIGTAKTLKPTTKTYSNPQQIFQQFNELANKKVLETKEKVESEPAVEASEELESLYTEEFDEDA